MKRRTRRQKGLHGRHPAISRYAAKQQGAVDIGSGVAATLSRPALPPPAPNNQDIIYATYAFHGWEKPSKKLKAGFLVAVETPEDSLKRCYLAIGLNHGTVRVEQHVGAFNEASGWEGTKKIIAQSPAISLRQAVNAIRDWSFYVSPTHQGKDTQQSNPKARVLYWTDDVTDAELSAIHAEM